MIFGTLLNVAIGISLVYLLFSLACSSIVEWLAGGRRWRAANFKSAICNLLDGTSTPATVSSLNDNADATLATTAESASAPAKAAVPNATLQHDFKAHPLIVSLASQGNEAKGDTKGWPSYLSADLFTTVAFDLASSNKTQPVTFWRLRDTVDNTSGTGGLRQVLKTFIHDVEMKITDTDTNADQQRLALLRDRVQAWYDEGMSRASGWYKRRSQKAILFIAIVLCLLLNLDTIALVKQLAADPQAQQALVELASHTVKARSPAATLPAATSPPATASTGTDDPKLTPAEAVKQLNQAGFAIGWQTAVWPQDPYAETLFVIQKIIGLAITIFALSLGAPFWFDTLSRLVNLRATGAKPATAAESAADDVDQDAAVPIGTITGVTPIVSSSPTSASVAAAKSAAALPANYWSLPARKKDVGSFAYAASSYTPVNAAMMARASLLAYQPFAQLRRTLETAWDLPTAETVVEVSLGEQAFAFATKDYVIVAFRGTVPAVLETILADAEICLTEDPANPGTGRVHCGFLAAVNAVAEPLNKFLEQHAGKPVFVTGHSLGAAMASLFTARLLRTKTSMVAGLYTFGSPRVGDEQFVKALDAQLIGKSYRFVNDQDLVTRVAPRQFDYEHLAQVMYLDANGQLQQDGVGWTRFLNTVIDALGSFRDLASQSLSDHGIELYLKKLENVA